MSYHTIVERLERLELLPPAAERFDDGPSLRGRVAVLPASFNPPTAAHVELLRASCSVAGVESAAAMLTTRNVDKRIFGAPLPDRVAMLLEIQRANGDIAVLACNQARLTDQAPPLRDLIGGDHVDFIVGYDTLTRIFDDSYYEHMPVELDRFFTRHRLIAANRGEATVEAITEYLNTEPVRTFAERIEVIELPPEAASLSSTRARDALTAADDPEGVPAQVRDYIERRGLYRD